MKYLVNLFSKNSLKFILILYSIISLPIIFLLDGTNGSGDSVNHYLFARYAGEHTELFFNHWAKPIFTLFAFPFAQIGFVGLKLFNVLLNLGTITITFKIAEHLKLKNPELAILFLVFSPRFFALTYSGFTEFLFAFFLSMVILLMLKEKIIQSLILLSFMPFIRSEGLIIICVFALFLVITKKKKYLVFLSIGHIIYALAGYSFYHDLLWVFNKIPYAKLSSIYGSGDLFYFFYRIYFVYGLVVYFFLIMSFFYFLRDFKLSVKDFEFQSLIFLIFGSFVSFFCAHSLFWYFGIFESMGLMRPFVGVTPIVAILGLIGFNKFNEKFPKFQPRYAALAAVLFCFSFLPGSIPFKEKLTLTDEQKMTLNVIEYLKSTRNSSERYMYFDPYFALAFDIDPYDSNESILIFKENISKILLQKEISTTVLWDNRFCVKDAGVEDGYLDKMGFSLEKIFVSADKSKPIIYKVYNLK